MPGNFYPADRTNPYADFGSQQLYSYLRSHGVARARDSAFVYSNLGVGLLGQALAIRAGRSYAEQLREEITAPLNMNDTVVNLSEEQRRRFLQGHDDKHHPVHAWDLDALAGAGAIRSTATDMITYLEANLHPEKYAALAVSHRPQETAEGGSQIALAWFYSADSGLYRHGGATGGFSSHAFFNPRRDFAAVVLLNSRPNLLLSADVIGEHIRQRLSGDPAISLDTVVVPASTGLQGLLRSFSAYWFTMLAAGVFVYGLILVAQGLAAQVLPRRLFLRLSGYLQLAAICVIVGVYFLQPGFTGLDDLTLGSIARVVQWLPSYWFMALYQQLNGSMHPALGPLAGRAWIGLAGVLCGTPLIYTLSYWRTMRKIVEEPDIAPGARHLGWLPRFGSQAQTAIGQFSVRTLVRSRQHRLILAFYLGVGLAFTCLLLKDPATKRQFVNAAGSNPWREASVALWAASVGMMVLAVVGTRVVFTMPLDVRANWIFRITGGPGGLESLTASRRALVLLSVLPVWLVEAVVCFGLWPSWQSVFHLVALGLFGLIVADLCLLRFSKIPFACSWLPGKSRFHIAFIGAFGLLLGSIKGVLLERQALQEPDTTAGLLALLVAGWLSVRWFVVAQRSGQDQELRFEEEAPPVLQGLGLYRDGVMLIKNPRNAETA